MLIVNAITLLLFLVLYILSLKHPIDFISKLNKNEHKLYFFYPMVDYFIIKTRLNKLIYKKASIADSIKALTRENNQENIQRLYWCNRISTIFVVIILFCLLSLVGQLQETDKASVIEDKYILRPDYGEGSTSVDLDVTFEDSDSSGAAKEDLSLSHKMTIHVLEKEYSQEELAKIIEESVQFLQADVLGKNESAELIYENLHFCDRIPGTSISVDWEPEDYNIIQSDGRINNENIKAEGKVTSVTAVLTYLDQQTEYDMTFRIMPKVYSREELLQRRLEEEIVLASEKTAKDTRLELPDRLDNYRLTWTGEKENIGLTIFTLGVILALLIWVMGDKELEKQMKLRKEQLLQDYPEIINKFTLLVNAGMTVKQAWNKIAEDYREKAKDKKLKKRYAYEEMLTTVHELQLGLSEAVVYEQFGRRVGLIPYIKFSAFITQNLKKGNKGFTDQLNQEAIQAFEERKETAKRLGEEAGTKLLMPMMLMLVIVFLIILIPAFIAFQI